MVKLTNIADNLHELVERVQIGLDMLPFPRKERDYERRSSAYRALDALAARTKELEEALRNLYEAVAETWSDERIDSGEYDSSYAQQGGYVRASVMFRARQALGGDGE